jgi:hypothetical protein
VDISPFYNNKKIACADVALKDRRWFQGSPDINVCLGANVHITQVYECICVSGHYHIHIWHTALEQELVHTCICAYVCAITTLQQEVRLLLEDLYECVLMCLFHRCMCACVQISCYYSTKALYYSRKSGSSLRIFAYSGWNWNQPAKELPNSPKAWCHMSYVICIGVVSVYIQYNCVYYCMCIYMLHTCDAASSLIIFISERSFAAASASNCTSQHLSIAMCVCGGGKVWV